LLRITSTICSSIFSCATPTSPLMMAAAPPTPLVRGSLPSNMAGLRNAENSGTSCVLPALSVNGMVSLIMEWPTRYMAPANSSEMPELTLGL
jgi:hypothetical protein